MEHLIIEPPTLAQTAEKLQQEKMFLKVLENDLAHVGEKIAETKQRIADTIKVLNDLVNE